MVGVTGTNGKTTTTEMVTAAMRAAGRDAVACGNIGRPLSLSAREGHEVLVVEASSFQLRFVDTCRKIGNIKECNRQRRRLFGSRIPTRNGYGRAAAKYPTSLQAPMLPV